MVFTRSKHIHATGILSLSIDQSGTNTKTICCCSSDETFGVWTCSSSGALEVEIQTTANKCQGALVVYGEDVYLAETSQDVLTGVDRQVVVRYGLSAFLPSHPLMTFSLEVTALACNGVHLIAGSNDFLVKCLRLNEGGMNEETDRYECDGVILSISISPNGEHYSISTANGYIQIRSTSKSSKKPIAKFKACDQFSHIREDSPRIHCCWQPDGKHLYYPSKGCIIPVECETWEKKRILTHPEIANESFSIICLSLQAEDDSFYMAASTIEGSIAVWRGNATQFHLLNIHKKIQRDIGIITSIAFNPQNYGILLIAYSEGYICSMTDAKKADPSYAGEANLLILDEATESTSHPANGADGEELDGEIDDMETDLGLIKSQFGFDHHGERGGEQIQTTRLLPSNYILPPQPTEPCTSVKGMSVPKTFAVGSTAPSEEGRYLVWNSFGIIKSYKSGDESTIEINFHDSTIHHEVIMDNTTSNYTIGDINAELIALASKRNSNKESELYVHHVASWDHESRKWSQTMGDGEVIECLSLGQEFIALFTNLRYLRIFTPSGTQRYVISLEGNLLTMCAKGNKIAAARPTGGVIVESEDDYEHQIVVSQYEVSPLAGECSPTLEWTVPLAISPYSKLEWIQFSTLGNLVTMDSECTVRLHLHQKAVWIPVMVGPNLLKDPEADFIWPIALTELPRAQFRYIYCRNSKHPPVNKNPPPPTTVPFDLPFINSTTEKGKLEAELMAIELQQFVAREQQFLRPDHAKEMGQLTQNYIANLLKLFSVSCQMNRESRAAEIAHRATNPKLVQGLCNYAAKIQRPNLSEKVATIGRGRLRAIENEQHGRRQQPGIAQRQLEVMANSTVGTQAAPQKIPPPADESPIIAPAKILMSKRKTTQFGSLLLPSNNSKSIDKNQQMQSQETLANPFARAAPMENGEREGMEGMDDDDGVSSIGGESELDISTSSSALLSNSMFLDASPANNPFKKARKTPALDLTSSLSAANRGFKEKAMDENEAIPDFFDTLASNDRRKNKI